MTAPDKAYSSSPKNRPSGTPSPQPNPNANYAPRIGGFPCVYPYAASPGTVPLVCSEHLTLGELVPTEESTWYPMSREAMYEMVYDEESRLHPMKPAAS